MVMRTRKKKVKMMKKRVGKKGRMMMKVKRRRVKKELKVTLKQLTQKGKRY